MKTVKITGLRQCELIEVAEPKLKENFCLIKIIIAPMCTEYHSYKKGIVSSCLGHEAAGEIVETGPAASLVKKSDRVVVMPTYPCGKCYFCGTGNYIHCRNNVNPLEICNSETGVATYAQYCIKQEWLLLPIPENISYEHASMACCGLGPTFGAMQSLNVSAFDTVLIIGLGPVGLGGVINGVYRGAKVIAADIRAERRKIALDLGAVAVVDPNDPDALKHVESLTKGLGVDRAIECTGIPSAQKFAIDSLRRLGHAGFVGWKGHIELGNMVPDGKILQGCWHWNLNDRNKIFSLIEKSSRLIDVQITHSFPMSKVKDAWELQLTGKCGKVLLKPWE